MKYRTGTVRHDAPFLEGQLKTTNTIVDGRYDSFYITKRKGKLAAILLLHLLIQEEKYLNLPLV
jgi:hypothetical protein